MIFDLEVNCFQKNAKTLRLVELADIVIKGRHRLFIKDNENTDYLDWLERLPIDLRDIWELSLDLSVELEALEPARITIKVCETSQPNSSSSPPVLGVIDAFEMAREAFLVFVENDDADRNFLLTFASSDQKAKIKKLEDNKLFRFEHSGGIGELPKKAARFVSKKRLFSTICAAVFDSDASQPGDISADAKAVTRVCDEHDIAVFMLERRAIENYLLLSWLNSWINKGPRGKRAENIDRYKGFCKLNKSQRAHFHMKKGLTADMVKISNGLITLYGDLDEPVRLSLAEGFGSDVGSELYSLRWFQDSRNPSEDPDAWDEVNGIVKKFLVLCR